VTPVLAKTDDFAAFMAVDEDSRFSAPRRSEGTGRPVGAP